jgi:hypothetical protein
MSKIESGAGPVPTSVTSGDIDINVTKKGRRGFRIKQQPPLGPSVVMQRHSKFEGKCDKLKGHVYDCADIRQSDMFMRTTKEIAEYVGSTYKQGGDICRAVEGLSMPTLHDPPDPPENATRTQLRKWEKKVDEFVKRELQLEENIQTLYSLVWGQCTDIMRQRIEALNTFADMSDTKNGLELLRAIKNISYNVQHQKKLSQALHESKRRYYSLVQTKHETTQMYLEQYRNVTDVLTHSGAIVGFEPGLFQEFAIERNKTIEELTEEDKAEIQERYHAMAFLLGADRNRFGKLIEDLENEFLRGHDDFPKTLTSAYHLLTNWKHDPRNTMRIMGPTNEGVSFVNEGTNDSKGVNFATESHKGGKKQMQRARAESLAIGVAKGVTMPPSVAQA